MTTLRIALTSLSFLICGACNGASGTTATTASATGSSSTGSTSSTSSSGSSSETTSSSATSGATETGTSSTSGTTGTTGTTDSGTDSDTSDTGADVIDLPELEPINGSHFATSPICADCHSSHMSSTAMRDEDDRPIGADDLWQGSMMANAARDPFWWAMVAAETATFPGLKDEIEGECMPCHTPMAVVDGQFHDDEAPTLDWLFAGDDRANFGLDGVACAACHQIQPDNLGTEASFSGHYVIKQAATMFGPHADPFQGPMMMHTSFLPQKGDQILDSGHCGSCHTLRTSALDPDGTPNGHSLVEQSPYLEWRLSDYTTEGKPGPDAASCQDCHVPKTSVDAMPLSTKIARRPNGSDFPQIQERSPFGRHVMVGGNSIMPLVIRDNAGELHPRASDAALANTAAAARSQLETATATLGLNGAREGDDLVVTVDLTSHVGHKLPSAFPSRRTWIALSVKDKDGALVFRSGGTNDEGFLVDAGDATLASEAVGGPVQPHFQEISASDEVQIYESVMGSPDNTPVFRLLQGAQYYKDTRLLPKGWKSDAPEAKEVAPVGVDGDPDFIGGGDITRYRINAPASAGPYTVKAEFCYQILGARFAAELFAIDASRVRAFERMFMEADRKPVIMSTAELAID